MTRRTQVQLAEEAKARLEKEKAKLELDVIRAKRDSVRSRRRMLSIHRAAEQNRFTADWVAPPTSADSEIIADMPRMVARARQQVRDEAWGASIPLAFRRNVVGTGIRPSVDDEAHKDDWRAWSLDPLAVDREGAVDFAALQEWAIEEMVIAGEAFVVRWITRDRAGNRRLTLQRFEFEQLDGTKIADERTGNSVRHGIEVDEDGRRVAFHFYRDHPNDTHGAYRHSISRMAETVRIPASMVCHIYDPRRVRQTHGVTWLRPVLNRLRNLSEYDAAQLRAARAEAALAMIVKGPNAFGEDECDPLSIDGLQVGYIGEEESITPFTPTRPGNTYDPFVRTQLKAIAAGIGISYEQLTRDFDSGSYSSKRQSAIEDRREFRKIRQLLIRQLCRPVFEDFLHLWAGDNPEASGDYFFREASEVTWRGDGWEWVDPEAQGKGVERMMRLGLTNRTQQAEELGTTVSELDEVAAKDGTEKLRKQLLQVSDRRESPAPDGVAMGVALSARTPGVRLQTWTQMGSSGPVVDREAGIISGVSVITEGTTKPSGGDRDPFDVDAASLQQVADAINASEVGVKSRITHPEIDGHDDLPMRLGYIRSARVDGRRVVADMHFHSAEDIQAIRLMDIAENDPTSCGLSIVSVDATLEPSSTSTGLVMRLSRIDAVDWVGAPAANPAGMLSAQITLTKGSEMNEKQKDFLRQIGLPWDATDEQTAAFIEAMDEEHKAQFAALKESKIVEDAAEGAEGEGVTAAEGEGEEEEEEEEEEASGVTAGRRQGARGLTLSEVKKALKAERKAERARSREIRQIALKCSLGDAWANKHIDDETPIADVRRIALSSLKRAPEDMPITRVAVGSDLNRDTIGAAISDAILLRAGARQFVKFDEGNGVILSASGKPEARTPHARASEFRNLPVLEMGRRMLVSLGHVRAQNMSRTELATLLMSRTKLQAAMPGVYLAHSTGDFPQLLADAMGKSLRQQYALAPHTWSLWANRTTAPDFKDIKSLQLSEAADMVPIPEGGEYRYARLTEAGEVYRLVKYGTGLKFTREMLINDDTRAFDRAPRLLANSAARNVEALAIDALTGNRQMADGSTLFSTAHANIVTGPLTRENLGKARAALRMQTALGSDDPLELTPRFLIVPESLATDAQVLVSSSQIFETGDTDREYGTYNPFQGLQVISSPRLDAVSETQWYLSADPGQIDTIEVAFLEGEEVPHVEEEDEFDTDVRRIKIRHHAASAPIDFRGLVRSTGT